MDKQSYNNNKQHLDHRFALSFKYKVEALATVKPNSCQQKQ